MSQVNSGLALRRYESRVKETYKLEIYYYLLENKDNLLLIFYDQVKPFPLNFQLAITKSET